MVTPGAQRDAVARARARGCDGLSERRACHLIGIARRVARYQPSRPDDTDLRQRLLELAAARRVPQRDADYLHGAGTGRAGRLALGLQHRPAAFETG
jgi:hypothetical protein